MTINWLLFVFAILSLLAGGYLARLSSDLIRKLVVRLMPVEKRFSDDSFRQQMLRATIIGWCMTLLLGGGFFWGSLQLLHTYTTPTVAEQEQLLPVSNPIPVKTSLTEHTAKRDTTPVTIVPTESPQATASTGTYFLQLGAYDQITNAREQVNRYRSQLEIPVQVKQQEGTDGPYKVWVGPLGSRKLAADYRQAQQLKATIVKVE